MPNANSENEKTSITLTNGQWAQVMHCIIVTNHTPGMRTADLPEIGSEIANACPEGSAAWFGRAGLVNRDD